jgi:hypothetical protein
LRRAGDFRAAALLNARGKILLHNVSPEFPADWLEKGSEIRRSRMSDDDLVAWLTPETSSPKRSGRVR